jgi:hypothetical protein
MNFFGITLLVSSILSISFGPSQCQRDSSNNIGTKMILPGALMTSGLILNKSDIKVDIQNSIQSHFDDFHTDVDDVLSFTPLGIDLLVSLMSDEKAKLKNLTDIAIAQTAILGLTLGLKKVINAQRPNGRFLSFPSGHTSQAFTVATLLYLHFKDQYPFLASTGYVFAGATGVLRVINNEHWVSDVFFGAGLGILVGALTYHFNPFGRNSSISKVELTMHGGQFGATFRF